MGHFQWGLFIRVSQHVHIYIPWGPGQIHYISGDSLLVVRKPGRRCSALHTVPVALRRQRRFTDLDPGRHYILSPAHLPRLWFR